MKTSLKNTLAALLLAAVATTTMAAEKNKSDELGGKGKGDDLVHRILAANGKIIFIIKTEYDALRHFGHGDSTANNVGGGDFGKGGGGGGECQRGSEQELLHVNLLNAREKGAGNGTRDYRVTRR